jgi:acetyltransferase-like isoleucine patch superfamily enzyme
LSQQEKFRRTYPRYTLGVGTYGLPKVHDDDEGTTLRIGAYCSISSEVQIFLGKNHRVDWVSSYPFPAFFVEAKHIPEFGVSRGDVTIGSDVWLCANCMILSGVTVGHGAVIGAGAVVTRDVQPYSVVAGNPAKHVRWRFDEKMRQELLATAWWDWPEAELRGIVEILCSDRIPELLDYAKKRKNQNSQ